MTAAYQGKADVVRLLLAHGADPTLVGCGDTAARAAERSGDTELVQLLRDSYAPRAALHQPWPRLASLALAAHAHTARTPPRRALPPHPLVVPLPSGAAKS